MIGNIFLEIQQTLFDIQGSDGLPIFKHFDLWNQQVSFLEKETPFEYPAIFIEFGDIDWQTGNNKTQRGDTIITIHIVTRWFNQTAKYSPSQVEALQYLNLPNLILKKLQSSNISQYCNNFNRIKSVINHNHESIVDSTEQYTCLVHNYEAMPTTIAVTNVSPLITINNGNV